MAYTARKYRSKVNTNDLVDFQVTVKETDLLIRAESDLTDMATNLVLKYRKFLEDFIALDPLFKDTLEPYPALPDTAPRIVLEMIKASSVVNAGPMAAVAGAIAEFVGIKLLEESGQVIVENGGDIFIKTDVPRIIGLYAGSSTFTHKIGLKIEQEQTPMGVCTSSGMVGHSLSFGKADAVVVTAKSTLLADAAATVIGNLIQTASDFNRGIEFAKSQSLINGVLIVKNDKMAVWGDIQIEKIS